MNDSNYSPSLVSALKIARGITHYHRLTCAYLVPTNTASVLLNHPDSIFL